MPCSLNWTSISKYELSDKTTATQSDTNDYVLFIVNTSEKINGMKEDQIEKSIKIARWLFALRWRHRRRRHRITAEDKNRLVWAFEDQDQKYLVLADTLRIYRLAARCIVFWYLREGRIQDRPLGGRNNVRFESFDNVMRQCLQQIVNKDCTLTLEATKVE